MIDFLWMLCKLGLLLTFGFPFIMIAIFFILYIALGVTQFIIEFLENTWRIKL